jgi:general bacterial porin, GBP family
VFFRVETAFNPTTGVLSNNGQAVYNNIYALRTANTASAIDGQWLARASYVGASDPVWGSLELGRTVNFSADQVAQYDPVQAALLFSPLGFSGVIGGGLGATENSRLDSSAKYTNAVKRFSFGAQYKFTGDTSAQSAGHGYVSMLGFEDGPFSFKGTWSEITNSVAWAVLYSNVIPPPPNVQVQNTKGYMLTALYKAGAATAKVGYESVTVWAPSNTNFNVQDYFGLFLPKPSVNATGELIFTVFWVGGDYKLTPNFDLGVGFYDIDTYSRPEVGNAYWAQAYSLLADYSFTSRFDAYFGIMATQYSGVGLYRQAPINAYTSNCTYGVGVRFKF